MSLETDLGLRTDLVVNQPVSPGSISSASSKPEDQPPLSFVLGPPHSEVEKALRAQIANRFGWKSVLPYPRQRALIEPSACRTGNIYSRQLLLSLLSQADGLGLSFKNLPIPRDKRTKSTIPKIERHAIQASVFPDSSFAQH